MKQRILVTTASVCALLAVALLISGGTPTTVAQSGPDTMLPQAKPGECYAKVLVPAEYKTQTETVVIQPASESFKLTPPRYEWANEKVLVKEASKKIEAIPAKFETKTEKIEIRAPRAVWRTGSRVDAPIADITLIAAASALGLPANPEKGLCFAEYTQNSKFDAKTEKVLVQDAHEKVEIVPAEYEWVEERVLAKPASFKLMAVAAEYETVTEKVLKTAAYTTWKKGRGPVEKLDNASGEIMCLIEVPAKYETLTKRVLKSPAATKKVEIPAEYTTMRKQKLVKPATVKKTQVPADYRMVEKSVQVSGPKAEWVLVGKSGTGRATGRKLCRSEIAGRYQNVTKRVMSSPATTKESEIPAAYKTVRVRKLSQPAQETRVAIPAKSQEITKRIKVTDGKMEWRQVLCETNMSKDLIVRLQETLQRQGYDPGPVDGVLGGQTMNAVAEFQSKKGMPRGGLTLATFDALGISLSKS